MKRLVGNRIQVHRTAMGIEVCIMRDDRPLYKFDGPLMSVGESLSIGPFRIEVPIDVHKD